MEDREIRNTIKNTVTSYWSTSNRPIFLTQLKSQLKRHGFDLGTALGGRKLKSFLEADPNCGYKLVKPADDHQGLQWALLPENADAQSAFAKWESDRSEARTAQDWTVVPRYDRSVFAAFIKPLETNHRRYIRLGASVTFRDLLEGEKPVADAVEIPRQIIKTPEQDVINSEIAARIDEWATAHNISYQELAPKKRATDDVETVDLASALMSLDRSELARISIPLDLVLKILKR